MGYGAPVWAHVKASFFCYNEHGNFHLQQDDRGRVWLSKQKQVSLTPNDFVEYGITVASYKGEGAHRQQTCSLHASP